MPDPPARVQFNSNINPLFNGPALLPPPSIPPPTLRSTPNRLPNTPACAVGRPPRNLSVMSLTPLTAQ